MFSVGRVYVDSNVLISLIQDEFGKGNEFMSYRTRGFLDKALSCIYTLVISDWCLEEIQTTTKLSPHSIQTWLDSLDEKVEIAVCGEEDRKSARELLQKKIAQHWSDALHAAVCKRSDCETLVTWNTKDFNPPEINAKTPTEL